ncbi:MAG: ABC transporter permease subunit [Pseudomonadales bacterium]|nr:ABC transporter permease subunit [Pseudomonadales bacterium]
MTSIVGAGGISVMLLIGAIFVYLLSVALPLLAPADLSAAGPLRAQPRLDGTPVLLDVEESGEIAIRIDRDGELLLLDARTGALRERHALGLGAAIRRVHRPEPNADLYGLETEDGRLHFLELTFPVSFASGERERGIRIEAPFEDTVVDLERLAPAGIDALAVHLEAATLTLALLNPDGAVRLVRYEDAERGLPLLPPTHQVLLARGGSDDSPPTRLLIAGSQWLYVVHENGRVDAWDVRFADDARRLASTLTDASAPDQITHLLGGGSLLVPTRRDGRHAVEHWFPARGEDGTFDLQRVRAFETASAPARIVPEARRRGFLVLDAEEELSIHHTTAERTLLRRRLDTDGVRALALSARADLLLLEDREARLHRWEIDNEHPETSFSALFTPVWYEGYAAPTLSWQSSAASTDAEPKFSLVPLVVGTIKAALYSMLFAIPVAIFGAIYTAYFMAPVLRSWVKPTIEIMAALPTVILGFLAGLWLAPIVERELAPILTFLVLTPALCIAAAVVGRRLPSRVHEAIPDGWQALAMVPLLIAGAWAATIVGPWLEEIITGGDLRSWLRTRHDIDYEQRNAIVVGVAMGVAVIPVIFTIAEDAIHSVPTRLAHGALALGATRWQTLLRVVLPTASPGIFSALLIGFGRAVGETMIVLMASGNTPVLDLDPFSGMRTFAANLAVELPESEVASTHYRILFLSALVLFVFTFLVNTVGELVRQRLRERYGHL